MHNNRLCRNASYAHTRVLWRTITVLSYRRRQKSIVKKQIHGGIAVDRPTVRCGYTCMRTLAGGKISLTDGNKNAAPVLLLLLLFLLLLLLLLLLLVFYIFLSMFMARGWDRVCPRKRYARLMFHGADSFRQ